MLTPSRMIVTRASAASPSRARLQRGLAPGPVVGDAEALDVDALGRDAGREQRRLGLVVDAVRAADEGVVDAAGVDQRRQELADLVAAEPAAVERQVGRLLREHHGAASGATGSGSSGPRAPP